MTMNLQPLPIVLLMLLLLPAAFSVCRNFCNNIPIKYPFSIDDGCGAPQLSRMLNCSSTDLSFVTPSSSYTVQTIDYSKKSLTLFDPSMSTCSILQPHHDFLLSDTQSLIIPPSPDTVFALINCSADSPVLNRYSSLCFNFSGHSCDQLYPACNAFRIFHMLSNTTPGCCFTRYDTLKFMKLNVLDCTHYTSVYNVDGLRGIGPLDWMYGIKLTYSVPDLGCQRCTDSGGTCGFDMDTQGFICICSSTFNRTTDCVAEGLIGGARRSFQVPRIFFVLLFLIVNF